MNSNQLIIYNNPIKSVFNNFLTKVKAKFTSHKTFNREVEKQLQKEFTNKDELNYARKLLKEILSRNKLALEDIDKLDDSQEKRIVQELKAILQENNIEKLRNINLNEDYRNYEGTLNIFSNLKNAYLRKYKETLYQLKDNDYIETQSTKIKGKKKNIRIYNI